MTRCKAARIETVKDVPTVRRCTYDKGHEKDTGHRHEHGWFGPGHTVRWAPAANEMVVS